MRGSQVGTEVGDDARRGGEDQCAGYPSEDFDALADQIGAAAVPKDHTD